MQSSYKIYFEVVRLFLHEDWIHYILGCAYVLGGGVTLLGLLTVLLSIKVIF